jgi:hypothetical protein
MQNDDHHKFCMVLSIYTSTPTTDVGIDVGCMIDEVGDSVQQASGDLAAKATREWQ